MKNVHDLEFSALSKAVQITDEAPVLKLEPEGGVHEVFRTPEPSVALALIS